MTDLKGSEATAYAIADNRTAELATWDDEVLAAQLNGLLADDPELSLAAGYNEAEIEAILFELTEPESNGSGLSEKYSRKIDAPIYKPTGDCPEIAELCDDQKTKDLEKEIQASSLSSDLKTFLLKAAQRHTVFDYSKIAEFYCHATPDLQSLMEKSALVIIDFNKAVENGYVRMSKRISELYIEDHELE